MIHSFVVTVVTLPQYPDPGWKLALNHYMVESFDRFTACGMRVAGSPTHHAPSRLIDCQDCLAALARQKLMESEL